MITNTNSVGVVRDAVVAWQLKANPEADWSLPVVAETYDGMLNDINGFHVKAEHVVAGDRDCDRRDRWRREVSVAARA